MWSSEGGRGAMSRHISSDSHWVTVPQPDGPYTLYLHLSCTQHANHLRLICIRASTPQGLRLMMEVTKMFSKCQGQQANQYMECQSWPAPTSSRINRPTMDTGLFLPAVTTSLVSEPDYLLCFPILRCGTQEGVMQRHPGASWRT